MWRRRQEHPYTAHIAPAGGSALREGEDYYRCTTMLPIWVNTWKERGDYC